eukprot:3838551-Amphidinium_carterae.1
MREIGAMFNMFNICGGSRLEFSVVDSASEVESSRVESSRVEFNMFKGWSKKALLTGAMLNLINMFNDFGTLEGNGLG